VKAQRPALATAWSTEALWMSERRAEYCGILSPAFVRIVMIHAQRDQAWQGHSPVRANRGRSGVSARLTRSPPVGPDWPPPRPRGRPAGRVRSIAAQSCRRCYAGEKFPLRTPRCPSAPPQQPQRHGDHRKPHDVPPRGHDHHADSMPVVPQDSERARSVMKARHLGDEKVTGIPVTDTLSRAQSLVRALAPAPGQRYDQ
jgi:hypothetical protein